MSKEIMTMEEMIEAFSLEGIGRANAVFNFSESDPRQWTDPKALWMNAEYLRTMPLEALTPLASDEIAEHVDCGSNDYAGVRARLV
ncbi:MAG: hypothetical protein WKF84_16085 [Pyrinomonadaceae bacterium]